MALKDAILATLLHGEASGYDLAKAFDVSTANFWTASPQQLYRELDRLADAGLVHARVVNQEKRPNKRVFSLSDAGRAALTEFIATDPKPTAIRDDLLVQVEAMGPGDHEAVRGHIAATLATSADKLARYERRRLRMLDGRDEAAYLAGEPRIGPYLTLARGIAFERGNIAWCHDVLAALDARDPAVTPGRA